MKIKRVGFIVLLALFLSGITQTEELLLQPYPVDSSGAANGGSVTDAYGGRFQLQVSTLATTKDSSYMTFRLGPIISEGVTAILGWLRLTFYSDTGAIGTDTLICRLMTSYDPSWNTLAAIDSNKFVGTGTWYINKDHDTLIKKYLYIDMQAITPDNLATDSTNYRETIKYRVKSEIIKQKFE
jgi:hypothetical protein